MSKGLVDFVTVLLVGVTLAALSFIVTILGPSSRERLLTEVAITEDKRRFKRIARAAAAS